METGEQLEQCCKNLNLESGCSQLGEVVRLWICSEGRANRICWRVNCEVKRNSEVKHDFRDLGLSSCTDEVAINYKTIDG